MRIKISVLGLVVLACGSAAEAGTAALELTDRCDVGASYVRLEDVATLRTSTPELEAAYRSIFLGPAPAPGASRTITLEEIRAELRKSGLNPDAIVFDGPASVVVQRPVEGAAPSEGGRPRVREQARMAIEAWLASRRTESDPPCRITVETVGGEIYPSEIQPEISSSGEWPAEGIVLSVSSEDLDLALGLVRFLLVVAKPEGHDATLVPVKATVKQVHRVLVASRPLKAGHKLTPADLESSRMEFSAVPAVYTDPSQVVGQPLKQSLKRGDALTPDAVRPIPVIQARQPVALQIIRDGYSLSLSGLVSTQAGAIGDVITVKDAATGAIKRGRVIGPGLIEPAEDLVPTPQRLLSGPEFVSVPEEN